MIQVTETEKKKKSRGEKVYISVSVLLPVFGRETCNTALLTKKVPTVKNRYSTSYHKIITDRITVAFILSAFSICNEDPKKGITQFCSRESAPLSILFDWLFSLFSFGTPVGVVSWILGEKKRK